MKPLRPLTPTERIARREWQRTQEAAAGCHDRQHVGFLTRRYARRLADLRNRFVAWRRPEARP